MARQMVPLLFALLACGYGCNVIRQEHSATSTADTLVLVTDTTAAGERPRLLTGRGEDSDAVARRFDRIGDLTCSLETQSDNGIRICGRFRCVPGERPQSHWLDLTVQNEQGEQRAVKITGISLSGFPAALAYTFGQESTLFGRGGYVQSLAAASWPIPAGTDRECKLSVVVEHAVPGGPTYRDTFVWHVRVRGC